MYFGYLLILLASHKVTFDIPHHHLLQNYNHLVLLCVETPKISLALCLHLFESYTITF